MGWVVSSTRGDSLSVTTCERIVNFNVPVSYSHHTSTPQHFLSIWWFTLPLVLRVRPLEWRTWLAFCRCFRHRDTCRVLQIQLNTRFFHRLSRVPWRKCWENICKFPLHTVLHDLWVLYDALEIQLRVFTLVHHPFPFLVREPTTWIAN